MTIDVSLLDKLLVTLDVRLNAFALINIAPGHRLQFVGSGAPVVHYVLTGDGVFEFPKWLPLQVKAGDVVVLPCNCQKAIRGDAEPTVDVRIGDRCAIDNTNLVRVDAGVGAPALTLLCGSLASSPLGRYGLFEKMTSPLRQSMADTSFVSAAFKMLRQEIAAPAFATHAVAGALMKICLALIIRERLGELLATESLASGIADARLRRIVLQVLEFPGSKHSVASLASEAGMSRSAFAAAFTTSFGVSPMAFVNKARLHHAGELLLNTDLPVKMIAASIGFTRSHFSRTFLATYGCDPNSFRTSKHHDAHQAGARFGGHRHIEEGTK